ncbi:hypothetical protein DEJ49_33625 [Streptomyces venezuelae]|uniref:Holin n=1 Tax=Streptomyces venezuelae TaxID=54571 RepID=A0A5P2CSK8_STRVZ|nr:hypothetical protein [Streptomyces venezuelae]QES45280.1 hypothetical protein DEJ49_33625 [Streptomyces venezuelae]
MKVSKYAKAVVAGLAAGAASLATAMADGSLSTQEGLTAVAAVLAAWGLTWAVPNKPQGPQGL